MKGKVQAMEWDEELENMSREKAAADANRGESKLVHEDYMLSEGENPVILTLALNL